MLHHGPESASGQRFASPEALALYRLNALDAQVKGVLEHGGRRTAPDTQVKWPLDADRSL